MGVRCWVMVGVGGEFYWCRVVGGGLYYRVLFWVGVEVFGWVVCCGVG